MPPGGIDIFNSGFLVLSLFYKWVVINYVELQNICNQLSFNHSLPLIQQSAMISKPISIRRGYNGLLHTCLVFHHSYQKGWCTHVISFIINFNHLYSIFVW